MDEHDFASNQLVSGVAQTVTAWTTIGLSNIEDGSFPQDTNADSDPSDFKFDHIGPDGTLLYNATKDECIESPDNKYIACIFVRDFGATTRESYHLSILRKGERLGNTSGNAFISYSNFEVEWVKPNELKVISKNGTVFKKVTQLEDIKIIYPN